VREPERLMGFVRTIVRRKIGEAIGERVEERARLCVSDITIIDRVVHNTTTPEHEFNEKQRAELARAEIAKLAARDREILTRFYILDQSKEQIRREMNLTETQFRLLKSRTKATLVERTSKLRTGGGRGSAVPVLPVN